MATYHELEKLKSIQVDYETAKQTQEQTKKLLWEADLKYYLTDEEQTAISDAHTAMEKLEDALFRAGLSLAQKLSKCEKLKYNTLKTEPCEQY